MFIKNYDCHPNPQFLSLSVNTNSQVVLTDLFIPSQCYKRKHKVILYI